MMLLSKYQTSFKAMENDDLLSDNHSISSQSTTTIKGDICWKVDTNRDGSLRTRYFYFESDVVDLTSSIPNENNDMASLSLGTFLFLRLFFQTSTVYTISTTILSTYASKYQFHDFAYLSDSSNCPSMFFCSQYFYGILRTTFFARHFRRIQVRKKKSNQISEKVIDTIKCVITYVRTTESIF